MSLSIEKKYKLGLWQNFTAIFIGFSSVWRWLPVVVGVGISTATLVLWQGLISQEHTRIKEMIRAESSNLNKEIAAELETRTSVLVRMAKRWEIQGGTPKQEWESDARLTFDDYGGYQAIEWVDPSFHVRWIVPLTSNEATQNLNLASSKQQRITLEAARNWHQVTFTHFVNLAQGAKGFQVYVPIFRGKDFQGFIVGVFKVQHLLDTILKQEPKLASGYEITVSEQEEIYSYNHLASRQYEQEWHHDTKVNLRGVTWRLRVWPTPKLLASSQSRLPQVVLFSGLLMAWLLALAIYLAQMTRIKQEQAEATTHKLEREIAERKQAQEALTQSQTRLKLINSLSTRMMLGMSVEQIIESTVKQINYYFKNLRIAYATIDERGNLTVIHSIEPEGMSQLKGLVVDLTKAPEYLSALRMKEPLIVEDVTQDARFTYLTDFMTAGGTRAVIGVPLQHSEQLVGLLCFDSPSPRKWSEHEITTLIGIAQYLSILIKDAYTQKERQQTDIALRESVSRLRLALWAAHMDTWDWDMNSGKVTYSVDTEANFGIAPSSFDGTYNSFLKSVHPEDHKLVAQAVRRSIEEHADYDVEFRVIWPDSTIHWVASKGQVYYDETGKAVRMVGVDMDITSRKQIEAALRESEERFKTFMNNSPVMAFMKDQEGRYVYVNEQLKRVFNVKQSDWYGKTDEDWFSEAAANQIRKDDISVISTGKTSEVLETVHTPDGFTHYWLVFKFPVKDSSGQWLLGGVAVDITQRKQAEEEIKLSLQEKEVLLKEVHHRVKNNLQIIDSLFRHQFRHTQDRQTTEVLKECQNRVNSMALLHEKLYQSKDLSKINLAGYIRSLLANLFNSYSFNTNLIDLKIEVDNIFVDFETALPCGLIVNELVSNSLKYAFPLGKEGAIQIKFHQKDFQNFMLMVKDDGVGLPKGFNFNQLQSLGLKLVRSLVRQLGGQLEINSNRGTEFLINFTNQVNANDRN